MVHPNLMTVGLIGALSAIPAVAYPVPAERSVVRSSTVQSAADNDACSDAKAEYQAAIGEVLANLHSYNQCVNDSKGRNDCSAEFGGLQKAHDNFAGAVSNYPTGCD
jgi:hypothetical protein